MRIRPDADSEEDGIAMAPLIDVVFLLLIYFLVATTLKEEDKDIEVDLPVLEDVVQVEVREEDFYVIGIDVTGQFYADGLPAGRNAILDDLREIKATEPDRRIRIDIDEDTPFGYLAEVLKYLDMLRLTNYGIKNREDEVES